MSQWLKPKKNEKKSFFFLSNQKNVRLTLFHLLIKKLKFFRKKVELFVSIFLKFQFKENFPKVFRNMFLFYSIFLL